MNRVSKDNIRTQLNLIFAMMRFLTTILDMASDNEMACSTIFSMAQGISEQSDALCHDVGNYISKLAEGYQPSDAEKKVGDQYETNNPHRKRSRGRRLL